MSIEAMKWQGPVVWKYTNAKGRSVLVETNTSPFEDATPFSTHPPQREWQGLTENEMKNLADTHLVYQVETPEMSGVFDLIRAVAKKLEEKNT
jgi:hypothetical protein